jgi:protein-disulfide isomerase
MIHPARTTRPIAARLLAVALAILALAAAPAWVAAQAIGDDVAAFLDATGAVPDGDGYRVGDLALAAEAPGDVLAGVRLAGALDDGGLADAAATLAIATGYGAGIEQPLATFLRDRAPQFAGQGPVRISVEAYTLELDVADAGLTDVALALSLPRVDDAAFGPPAAILGDPDAPVTIRVFSDFQCPFCQRYALEVLPGIEGGLLDDGDANFAFHHFPLTSIHANAVPAAEASQCVVERFGEAAFWPYHDVVFERLDAWKSLGDPAPYFARLARDVAPLVDAVAEAEGVASDEAADAAVAQLTECLTEGEARATVQAALDVALGLGLSGTPSVFVGGYKLNDFGNPQAYARLIRLAQAQASATTGE